MMAAIRSIAVALLVTHADAASADCKADAAAFEGYMRSLDRGFELVVMPNHTTLVAHDALVPTPHALQVNLTTAGITVGFDAVAPGKLGRELSARAKMQADPDWQKGTPGWVGHYSDVVLVVDESIPWSEVAEVAGLAASAGFAHAYFMFAQPEQATPPPHTSVDDVVAKAQQTTSFRLVALAGLRRGFETSCPPLAKAFGIRPRNDADWFGKTFVPAIGTAIAACDCKLDLAELRSWMFYLYTPIVQTGSLGVELAKTAKPVALAGKTPWREASKKLAAGTTWFVAR